MKRTLTNRSLFWPLVLVGAGIIGLLTNLGIFSYANLSVLFRLWPFILIVLGVYLLVGRRTPGLGSLLGLAAIAGLIGLMLVGPSLGWAADVEVKAANYEEPLGDVTSAQINLRPEIGDLTITPLTDSNNLFTADVNYIGEVTFNSTGTADKVVDLSQTRGGSSIFDLGILFNPDQRLNWQVGINPQTPLVLNLNLGTGSANLDLSAFDQLKDVTVNTGTGSVELTLPATEQSYQANVTVGTGSGTVEIEAGASVELIASSGTGGFTVDVPEEAAVRIEASTGTGSIDVPTNFKRLQGDEKNFVGDNGVWETANFAEAEHQIVIKYSGGTGGLEIQ